MLPTSPFTIIALSSVTLYVVVGYFGRSLRRKVLAKATAVTELPFLGEDRPRGKKIQGTAVICGGRQVLSSLGCGDQANQNLSDWFIASAG